MSTKDKLLYAALDLFSKRGYDGVSVDEIAQQIGIKGPSIYKYFSGKENLLDCLIDRIHKEYYEHMGSERDKMVIPKTKEEFIENSLQMISYTIKDEAVIKIRRLMQMEQFRNEKLRKAASYHQFYFMLEKYELIFAEMMRVGALKKEDSKLLAFEFVTPVSSLIALVDREPDRLDYAMELIKAHLTHFWELFGGVQ